MTPASINPNRLLTRLKALGEVGQSDGGGRTRIAYTDQDRQGRKLVIEWMRESGLAVQRDPIGNLFATLPGRTNADPVMTGSHIDTVGNAGHLDGPLGVLAGLEVIQSLKDAGVTPQRPITIAVFANEEGVRFQPDMMGSLVYACGLSLDDALNTRDKKGVRLGDALIDEAGVQPIELASIQPSSFVELHIEQGPILEECGTSIGIVEGVQGIYWAELTFTGRAGHAGTTPNNLRKDAGIAAMRFAAQLDEKLKALGPEQLVTFGQFQLSPDMINVIPRQAKLSLDVRNPDPATWEKAIGMVGDLVAETERDDRVEIKVSEFVRLSPVKFDPAICQLLEEQAEHNGLSHRRMTSGAGHDAQMMARLAPTAMIFVPSINGVSHNPAEATSDADIIAGAQLLMDAIWNLAN